MIPVGSEHVRRCASPLQSIWGHQDQFAHSALIPPEKSQSGLQVPCITDTAYYFLIDKRMFWQNSLAFYFTTYCATTHGNIVEICLMIKSSTSCLFVFCFNLLIYIFVPLVYIFVPLVEWYAIAMFVFFNEQIRLDCQICSPIELFLGILCLALDSILSIHYTCWMYLQSSSTDHRKNDTWYKPEENHYHCNSAQFL